MLHPQPRGQPPSQLLQIDPAVSLLGSPHHLDSRAGVAGQASGMPLVGCSWMQRGCVDADATRSGRPTSGVPEHGGDCRTTCHSSLKPRFSPHSVPTQTTNLLVGVSRRPCYQAKVPFFCIVVNMTSLAVTLSGMVCHAKSYLSTPCELLDFSVFRSSDGFLSQHGTRHTSCVSCGLDLISCPAGSSYTPRRFMKISPSSRGRALASPSS